MSIHADQHAGPAGIDLAQFAGVVRESNERAERAFRAHVQRLDANPTLEHHTLKATEPARLSKGETTLSIGVLNPNDITIYWGVGGARPLPGQRAIAQPGRSLMVLPLKADNLLFGADPADLADGDAPIFVMRYSCVQQAFLGSAS